MNTNRPEKTLSSSSPPLGGDIQSATPPQTTCNSQIHSISEKIKETTVPKRRRLVQKSGEINLQHRGIKHRGHRYMSDIFTTLLDLKWRYNILIFGMVFLLTWTGFGFLWWLVAFAHGDMDSRVETDVSVDICVNNVQSFVGAFLFSLETQTTIGYGYRSISEECPEAVFLLVCQSIVSCFIEGIILGAVLAKVSRSKKRAATLIFSRQACIAERDGKLCFMFRIGDLRSDSNIVEAHIRAYLIRSRITPEGEVLPLCNYDMNVGYDKGFDRLLLFSPYIITHVIDKSSPLFYISENDLKHEHFEIIVLLEGIVESMGNTTQVRSSYLPDEIHWGARFTSMITRSVAGYASNYSLFDTHYLVETAPDSAFVRGEKERRCMEENRRNGVTDDSEWVKDGGAGDGVNGGVSAETLESIL